jgi:uncharacterized membrane protein (UPF0127 family)
MASNETVRGTRARVIHETAGRCVATVSVANTPISRMVGLLGRATLAEGDGLVLDPCSSIHTWFMRFPIDVAFVRPDGIVVRQVGRMAPFRLVWAAGAAFAIELPAGTLDAHGVREGHRLRLEPL